jgi:hypothetical protein
VRVADVDLDALRVRFMAQLIEAWPEHDIPVDRMEHDLRVAVETDDDGPVLVIALLGTTTWIGFDGSNEDALALVDDVAKNRAYNLEGDRWIHGEGWREYRS